ncbi:uncharacterized protein [Typha latifolia]|uniref:uncharacterized protein isoform X2 n=1 Tax=Typha latifolia TaxID=4733 RepID=UPI003C2CD174
MAPAVEGRERPRRLSPSLSGSPKNRDRRSPRRRSPPRRERSPRTRSPVRTSSSHRPRSPSKQKQSNRDRSPRHTSSRSPSPRAKRLRRAQASGEEERSVEGDRRRNSSREEKEDKDARRDRAQASREEEKSVEGDRRRNSSKEEREYRDVRRDRKGDGERSSRRGRSNSPEEHERRGRHGSRSPSRASKGRTRDEDAEARAVSSRDGDHDSVAQMNAAAEALETKEQQKPSFELSGKLAEETNRVRGVTILFTEPPEARKPDIRWRLYVFKAGEVLNEPLYVHRQSCYLFGRERRVADVPTDHPSCSKQHAVLQFRLVEKEQPDGLMSKEPGICVIARAFHRVSIGSESKFSGSQHLIYLSSSRTSLMEVLIYEGEH